MLFPGIHSGDSTGHGLRVNGSARSIDTEQTEALNRCARDAQGFNSDGRGRGETAVRRTKTHLRREDPVAVLSLAVRRILQDGERCGLRFLEHAQEGKWMERGLAEDDWLRSLHDRFQRGAAGLLLALMLVGTVRPAFGSVRMVSVGIVRVRRGGDMLAMRMPFVGLRNSFVAVGLAAKEWFQATGRNRCQPKHHTSRRNDAKSEWKCWLAVRHVVNPLPVTLLPTQGEGGVVAPRIATRLRCDRSRQAAIPHIRQWRAALLWGKTLS